MFKKTALCLSLIAALVTSAQATTHSSTDLDPATDKVAVYAANTYQQQMVESLRALVKFNTVAVEGVRSNDNPVHIAFKQELAKQAKALGLDYTDYGYLVVIGLGDSEDRLGIITHGDVQPATPSKWAQSPYDLDITSEPGKLIGRGTEDDKAPIVNAMYAMKSIKDMKIALNKRIELYVYMAEESDWQPLIEFIKTNTLPQMNITLDSQYPAVTAEKGYGTVSMTFEPKNINKNSRHLSAFSGGFFGSQIPEDASATIEHASSEVISQIKAKAASHQGMTYTFSMQGKAFKIVATGKSTHSSRPKNGVNAITHLADILSAVQWQQNASGALVNFINDNMGTDLYGNKFGKVAYSDDFMGPMTVQATVIKQLANGIQLNINVRRPRGKSHALVYGQFDKVLREWQRDNDVVMTDVSITLKAPFVQTSAPQVPTLMRVFSHYTGIKDAKPVAIGGGTNSRLFPSAVSFGPTMPGKVYSGHSEHEFITMDQFVLNLKMYTAVFVELAK